MVRVSRCGESPFIPFEMADKRYRLLKEGHLDVKAPPDSPERILHKAWRRLWVRAIVFNPEGRGEPHFIMQLSRRAKDDEPMKHVKASRDGLRLFRCSSGSRALRCWALASGSTLLLYLAADTEKMTQEWMQTLREGLWPIVFTAHMPQEERHEVSLIDDEKSFASGLLGVYGRLVKTSEGMLSIIHPHWQGIQMRWRLVDIVDVKVLRTYDDSTDSGVFTLTVNSSGKDTRVLQFYSDTAIKTIDWIKLLLSNRNKSETKSHDIKPPVVSSHKGAEVIEENSETSSDAAQIDYAIVQKTKTNENLQEETKSEKNDTSTNIHEEVNKEPEKLLLNIPRTFLNASTNNFQLIESESSTNGTGAMNQQGSEEDSDDSSNGSYDHLYEDLDLLKDSRAYTVYEEVDDDDDECEYIPPAPPVLPARLEQIKNQKVTKDDELNLLEFDPIISTSLQKSQIETQNIASAAVTEHQSKTSLSRQTSQKKLKYHQQICVYRNCVKVLAKL
ncbi:uncharacterized protein CDAR_9162 [Caerostris darwini]|uniref:PH domain-containing protein n=1 Tax=Caerostris darwini TaxID=1538125 RepID=A0AAV4UYA7_9ARAC|nr:uncharacterized protein CDAR_9162 [Caerostris darwini]